jgi:hypothetical protein
MPKLSLPKLSWPYRLAVLGLASIGVWLFSTEALATYSLDGARFYGDQWAYARNSNYPSFSEDCTNFVSQAMQSGGGEAMRGIGGNPTDYHNWYLQKYPFGVFTYSHSWTVANDLDQYVLNGGTGNFSYSDGAPGNIGSGYSPLGSEGDIIFYIWNTNDAGAGYHWSVRTFDGTDPDSHWVGGLVDQHTTDRRSAYWTLQPYNSQHYMTTYVEDWSVIN